MVNFFSQFQGHCSQSHQVQNKSVLPLNEMEL